MIKGRRRSNHLVPILSSGGIIDGVEEVKEEVFRHFSSKFVESNEVKPLLEGIRFNIIGEEDVRFLERPFLEEEIKEAVWSCGGSRIQGPDGFSFLFIKNCWNFVKDDFVRFFKIFYDGGLLSMVVTSYFLTLIPKS